MKIYVVIVTLFLLVGCAHHSNNSSAVNIDGTWRGKIKKEAGKTPASITPHMTFNFKSDGNTVKGTVSPISFSPAPGNWIPLEDIKIKGKKISFTVSSMMGPREVKTTYTGKIKGEKIDLKIITEMPVIQMPGSNHSRVTDVHKRAEASGLNGPDGGTAIRMSTRTPGDENGGVYAKDRVNGVVYGASIPNKNYLTHKITIERISRIPEGPVN